MPEEWLTIPEFPEYEISSTGRVRNIKTGYVRTPSINKDGYHSVPMQACGKRRRLNIARTVCELWNGKPFPGALALHEDDNQANNTPENLYWGTYHDNVKDRRRHGNGQDGENNNNAIVTWEIVRKIRALNLEISHIPTVAREFSITISHCSNIVANRIWKE